MAWRPQWPQEAPVARPDIVAVRMAEADRLAALAMDRAGLEAAIAGYDEVVAIDPRHAGAQVNLAHLHLLLGDGHTRSRATKRMHFQKALQHAEAAMYTNEAFRERIRAGEPTWIACTSLGEADVDAMFFWVNAVFYQFKETLAATSQVLNFRWIQRARQVMDHMASLVPEHDIRIDFLFGAYYLSIPTSVGGDRQRSAAYFNSAVDNAPNMLLPRWGRAKYYHVKMGNPQEFREDLTWIITRNVDEMQDHPAWKHFFIDDARHMLATKDSSFHHRTGGHKRQLREHWPSNSRLAGPLPVVLVLHGAFSTARQMDQWAEWSALADREGFGVVFPEGIGLWGWLQHWNAGHCCGRAAQEGWDDVAFLDAVVDHLGARPGVDKKRIMMVGFSNGGMMVHRYAAERSEHLAAAAVVSGALNSLETPEAKPWVLPEPKKVVPLVLIHGVADLVVPIEGGAPLDGRNERIYSSLDDAVDFWARVNQSLGPVERSQSNDGSVRAETYHDRKGRDVMAVYRIEDWGHQWPGGSITRALPHDHPLRGFDAAETIWEFFENTAEK